MSVYNILQFRLWPDMAGFFLCSLTLFVVTLFSSSGLLAQSIESEQHYRRFVELYQQSNPSREDLLTGWDRLEHANQLAPATLKYVHQLGLAGGILEHWDEALRWLDQALNLATDRQQRQQIQIEFDYAILQQALQATRPAVPGSSQESQSYSVPGRVQVDLDLSGSATLPQRVSNHASRASHETPESILRKSLSRRHNLDTLYTQQLLLVAVNDDTSAASHYDAGIAAIYSFLSSRYSILNPQPQLIAMIYPDTDTLHSAARRIYPTLNLSTNNPLYGFYNSADHLLMATVAGENYGTLIHEMVHALFSFNSPALPAWFSEAVAILYQNSQLRGSRLQPLLDRRRNTLQPDGVPTLSSLAEQFDAETLSPDSIHLQLFLYFLQRNEKLQSLQVLWQNRDDIFQLNQTITELGIAESQWRRFLQLNLSRENSVSYSDLQKNQTAVQYIQLALNEILKHSLQVDGAWGPATEQALIDFQQSSELVADGIPGPRTMQQLAAQYGFSSIDRQPK